MRALFITASTFMTIVLSFLAWKHQAFPDTTYRRWIFYAIALWYLLFDLACIFLWRTP